jgi:outer membrane protein assembly factor BamB
MTKFFPFIVFHASIEGPAIPSFHPAPAPGQSGKRTVRRGLSLGVLFILLGIVLAGCTPQLGASTIGWSPVAASQGMVYVVTIQGEVQGLVDNGPQGVQVKWTFPGPEDGLVGAYYPPAVGDQLIYVSAIDGFLYALDKETGAQVWRQPQAPGQDPMPLVGAPALDESRAVVVVGSEDTNLYAYDAATGAPLPWSPFTTGDKIWSTPIIRNGTVYFGSHDHNVYAVDLANGQEKWRFTTEGAVVARPLLFQDMIIIGSFDRRLYALNAEDGTLQWEFEADNWFWAGAVANDTTVFAPSMDGNVYALDSAGNLLWEYQMGEPIVSTPVLLPQGLAVAAQEGQMKLLDSSPEETVSARVITGLPDLEALVKAPLFPLEDGNSVLVGAQNSTVRRIQITAGQEVLWCFNTERDGPCG